MGAARQPVARVNIQKVLYDWGEMHMGHCSTALELSVQNWFEKLKGKVHTFITRFSAFTLNVVKRASSQDAEAQVTEAQVQSTECEQDQQWRGHWTEEPEAGEQPRVMPDGTQRHWW